MKKICKKFTKGRSLITSTKLHNGKNISLKIEDWELDEWKSKETNKTQTDSLDWSRFLGPIQPGAWNNHQLTWLMHHSLPNIYIYLLGGFLHQSSLEKSLRSLSKPIVWSEKSNISLSPISCASGSSYKWCIVFKLYNIHLFLRIFIFIFLVLVVSSWANVTLFTLFDKRLFQILASVFLHNQHLVKVSIISLNPLSYPSMHPWQCSNKNTTPVQPWYVKAMLVHPFITSSWFMFHS